MSSTKMPHPYRGVRPWTRHSTVLFISGLIYIVNGATYFHPIPESARWEALTVARDWMPLQYWAIVWIAVGALAMISTIYPPALEMWGYGLLTGLATGWGGFYLMGVVEGGAPADNLGAALTWWTFAVLWWAISGLVNPEKVVEKVVVVDERR